MRNFFPMIWHHCSKQGLAFGGMAWRGSEMLHLDKATDIVPCTKAEL